MICSWKFTFPKMSIKVWECNWTASILFVTADCQCVLLRSVVGSWCSLWSSELLNISSFMPPFCFSAIPVRSGTQWKKHYVTACLVVFCRWKSWVQVSYGMHQTFIFRYPLQIFNYASDRCCTNLLHLRAWIYTYFIKYIFFLGGHCYF
jgi:hypothetical protein